MVTENTTLKSKPEKQGPPHKNRDQGSRLGFRSVAFDPPPECLFFNEEFTASKKERGNQKSPFKH